MLGSRVLSGMVLGLVSLTLTGCGALTQGLGSVTSEGLVDEYAIPQNRGLAIPTDFSRLPSPQNPRDVQASLPSQSEIESLMFTVEPEPVDDYVPRTVVTGDVPEYQPIGRIVGSGSSGAAQQTIVSTQTNAGGSLFPVYDTVTATSAAAPMLDPATIGASAPPPLLAEPLTPVPMFDPVANAGIGTSTSTSSGFGATGGEGTVMLSPEEAAALMALAIGAPNPVLSQPAPNPAIPNSAENGAQVVTSLPDGVTMVGAPVVLQR